MIKYLDILAVEVQTGKEGEAGRGAGRHGEETSRRRGGGRQVRWWRQNRTVWEHTENRRSRETERQRQRAKRERQRDRDARERERETERDRERDREREFSINKDSRFLD